MQWEKSNRLQRPRLNSTPGVAEFDLSYLRGGRIPCPSEPKPVSSYGMFRSMRRSFAELEMTDNNHLRPPESQLYRSSSTSLIGTETGRRRSSDRSGSSEDAYFVNNSRENLIAVEPRHHKPKYAFSSMGSEKANLGKLEEAAGGSDALFRMKLGIAASNANNGSSFVHEEQQQPQHLGKTYKAPSLFFVDGKREIDYILAYKDFSDDSDSEKKTEEMYIYEKNIKEAGLQIERVDKRYSKDGKTYFLKIHAPLAVLTRYAEILNMRMPIKNNDILIIHAVFCGTRMGFSAAFATCCALPCLNFHHPPRMHQQSFEILSSQAWLEEQKKKNDGWFSKLMTFFDYDSTLIPPEPDYFTAGFTRSKEDRFIIKHMDDTYTSAQRSYIVYQILKRARYAMIGPGTPC